MIFANNIGVSGGTFIPTFAFGAVVSFGFVQTGILPEEYYLIPVIIGMTSFLAALSKTPIMTFIFLIEELGGFSNILPISVGVLLAFIIVEISGISSIQDTALTQKTEKYYRHI